MVRIGYVKGTDAKKLAKRCDAMHRRLLDTWGSYSLDDLCMLYAKGDRDADVYHALASGMINEGVVKRVK